MNSVSPSSGTRLGAALSDLPAAWRSDHVMIEVRRAYRMDYSLGGYSLVELVRLACGANLEMGIRGGSGNKAEKRRILLVEHKMQLIRESLEAMIARSKRREAQAYADRQAEWRSEGRIRRTA